MQTKWPNLDNASIEKLLLNITNTEDFHTLYLLLKAPIYAYSLAILKNREDALDNVQDVFITLYHESSAYERKNKPLQWIFTITKNKAISKIRKRKPNNPLLEDVGTNVFAKEEDWLFFKGLMEKLKEEEKIILLLHLLWGFKHREIAAILNLNLQTVLSKYHRTIKKLKEMEVFE